MPKEYICHAFRLEIRQAVSIIEADNQRVALKKLLQVAQDGDLDFDDFYESEGLTEIFVEGSAPGDKDELEKLFPENSPYCLRMHNTMLLSALKTAEGFLSGVTLSADAAETLAVIRAAMAYDLAQVATKSWVNA